LRSRRSGTTHEAFVCEGVHRREASPTDDGAWVNVTPVATFEKMGFSQSELMKTNISLSALTGDVTDTRGVLSVELTVGSKTTPTTFFVIDVKGWYNLLLG
jgi:hypothetical protein